MEKVCCCLSQVFFYKKLVSPDHHVEVQQHRSGLPTTKEKRRRGKGDPHHTTPRTITHPLTTHTHTTHYTHTTHKGKEGKRKGKGGPFVCGLGTMCGMSVGCKR